MHTLRCKKSRYLRITELEQRKGMPEVAWPPRMERVHPIKFFLLVWKAQVDITRFGDVQGASREEFVIMTRSTSAVESG